MISLEQVSKTYGGSAAAAVDDVTLYIPDGRTVALIGPSGCGKTTILRMMNRLADPTGGKITIAGEDISKVDPVELRRRIGYVIQQVGLFPHMTIADNIGSVPSLLGWKKDRIARRVDELLDVVGLDPADFRARYPKQLSGGQQQRIGVARALAADPPVLLMDEPFGAIDPISRNRLQDELRTILSKVRKTVVIVTHDLDEAIKLGDDVAIMKSGRLVQYDTPEAILSRPANSFVEDFVGDDRAVRRLSLFKVSEAMTKGGANPGGHSISIESNLREALSKMIATGMDELVVEDKGDFQGLITRKGIFSF